MSKKNDNDLGVDNLDVLSDILDSSSENISVEIKKDCEELNLVGDGYSQDYINVVKRIKKRYDLLPQFDYNAIYKELGDLSVKSCPTPSLATINDELHKIQGAKDRLSEILIEVIKSYNFKKRAVDILKDSWGKFTVEKNTEGRKGDSTFRLSWYLTDFAETESLFKACDHILKNLDSLNDNLSRRITIWQLMTKVGDIGRGSVPDLDYDKTPKERLQDDFFNMDNDDSDGNDADKNKTNLESF